ncbi:SPOR domain-containing protein [Tepidicaulis sp. LMO-SS28]|uniref:SPOR domain-containing protein n=1 Tax=Tepidicaulis sp. LMO-SS28 TaxID=3447455 RepID=UPI003EE1A28C
MSDREDGRGRYSGDEEYHTYDATDEEEERGRGPFLLLGAVVLIAAFGGVLFFAYQQGVKEGMRSAPPVIRAENGPARVAPEDPGGIEIPHQDKRIYDRITGNEREDGVERLMPSAEEPLPLPQAGAPAPVTETVPPAESAPQQQAEAKPEEPAKKEAAPEKAEEPVIPSEPAASSSGNYVVQIAALRSEADAQKRFDALKGEHGDILGGKQADIQRADLGDKGVFYRLRIGYLDGKDAADKLCGQLKSRGVDCLVRTR